PDVGKRFILTSLLLIILAMKLAFLSAICYGAEKKLLNVGVYEDPPLSFMDERARPQGLFIDILREIVRKEGWQLKFEPCVFKGCLDRVKVGSLDLLGPVAYSDERAKIFSFNREPVFTNWGELYRRKDIGFTTAEDIKGKTIAMAPRDIYGQRFLRLVDNFGFNCKVLYVNDYPHIFRVMDEGKAQFGVVAHLFGMMHSAEHNVAATTFIFSPVRLHYIGTPGRMDDVLSSIDHYLLNFKSKENSVYYQTIRKWLGLKGKAYFPRWIIYALVTIGALALLFGLGVLLLGIVVRKRTAMLRQEIAAREASEAKARESESIYRALFENLPSPVAILDDEGKIIRWNRSFGTFWQVSGWDAGSKYLWEMFSDLENFRAQLINQAIDCALLGFPREFTIECTRNDGSFLAMNIMLRGIFIGGDVCVLCIMHDITQRIRLQQFYKQQWDVLRHVIDGMPIATILIDPESNVVVWNRATEILTNIKREHVFGRKLDLRPLFTGRDLPVPARLLLEKSPEEIEKEFRRRIRVYKYHKEAVETYGLIIVRGEKRRVHVVAAKLRDDDGKLIGVVQCARDITERYQLRESLAHAQKMEAIARLAGGFAHDLNNVLTCILGCCDLISLSAQGNSEITRYLELIRSTVKRTGKLNERLLGLGKKQFLVSRIVDVNEVVQKIAMDFKTLADEGVVLQVDTPDEPLTVKVDPEQLESSLINLLMNARDAMPEGGTIRLKTGRVFYDQPIIVNRFEVPAGEYVAISVADEGVGVSEEILKHMFEPYFTTKEGGSGMGLAVVHGFVKQSGGAVAVNSEMGKGTEVIIYLPLVASPYCYNVKESTVSPSGSNFRSSDKRNVLVVEDDESLATLIEHTLTSIGYKVFKASNAGDALKVLRENREIEIVILDIVLPDMNGIDLVKAVRATAEDVVLIGMSGYSESELAKQGITKEVLPVFISKPFTGAELIHVVRTVASRKL
ncbi:MAG TPA: PAS domain S-box protein, partial [Thermodesulforhabdus norvegica]|nr:PAS domain S-box protein [Thermodesulforhabdus norvegica]